MSTIYNTFAYLIKHRYYHHCYHHHHHLHHLHHYSYIHDMTPVRSLMIMSC